MTDYKGFRISELWAWTQVGDDDEEGIIAFQNGGAWVPCIASDRVRLDSLRDFAQRTANMLGHSVKLRRFVFIEDIEELTPAAPSDDDGCAHPRAVRVHYPDGRELCPACGMWMHNGDGEGE